MKKIKLFALLLAGLLLLAGCGAQEPSQTENAPNQNATQLFAEPLFGTFTATTLEGESASEEIFSGHKLTMVNIWATFCSPCINEMPSLGELSSEYGDDFQIVGIVVDAADKNGNPLSKQKADAREIVSFTKADYLHLLPSPDLNRAYLYGVQSVPETVFLDENGCQVGQRYIGARSKAEWKSIIDSLLEELA